MKISQKKAQAMRKAIIQIFEDGYYNDDGDFVLDCEPWDGVSDPPDTSDPIAIQMANEAIMGLEDD